MLDRRTKTTRNHKREIRNLNNPCSPPIASGSRTLPLPSPVAKDTDAILLLTKLQEHLVSQPQNSSRNLAQSNRTIISNICSNSCQNDLQYKSDIELSIRQQQLVNPKAIVALNHQVRKRVYPNTIANRMMKHIYNLSILLATICALFITSQHHVGAQTTLYSQLQNLKITPDIAIIPNNVKTIKFEINGNTVKPGESFPVKYFKDLNLAKVNLDVNNPEARYTLMLVDLDKKPNATSAIYNQFTSFNIPGNAIGLGQDMVVYEAPVVPCQSKHRLLMLALHQQQNIDIADIAYMSASSGQSTKRENFRLNDFIARHRLEVIAANLLYAAGETGSTCSGSFSLHSQGLSSIMIAMVISGLAQVFLSRRLIIN